MLNYFLVTESGAMVLTIFFAVILLIICIFLFLNIRRQTKKIKEENDVLIKNMITKNKMKQIVDRYAVKVGTFGSFTMFYISIYKYNNLKDILGKDLTEKIVKEIAEKLVRTFKGTVTIAQDTENSFIIFDKKEYSYEEIEDTCEVLLELVYDNSFTNIDDLDITASIGVALYPTCGIEFKELFKNLSIASYTAAKEGGNKYIIYSDDLKGENINLRYFNEVREAMNKKELTLYYQPIINIKESNVLGFEALIRWNHPSLGVIPPSNFIPILERSGDIKYLTKWALEEAIKLKKEINQMYPENDYRISINLSTKQIMDSSIVYDLKKIIKRAGIKASNIVFEIAQNVIFKKFDNVLKNVMNLQDMGFLISTDGLGLDYSTIKDLQSKHIDVLKIDKSFLTDVDENSIQEKYVNLLVDYCNKTNKTVICEGIESFDKLEYVKHNGINYVQGFYFSKPIPKDKLFEYLNLKSWINLMRKALE